MRQGGDSEGEGFVPRLVGALCCARAIGSGCWMALGTKLNRPDAVRGSDEATSQWATAPSHLARSLTAFDPPRSSLTPSPFLSGTDVSRSLCLSLLTRQKHTMPNAQVSGFHAQTTTPRARRQSSLDEADLS